MSGESKMKKYFLMILVLSLALGSFEWRASYCGQGMVSVVLPGGIKPDWFNGYVVLNDVDGWGGIYPGLVVNKGGSSEQVVNSIYAYGFDEYSVYVRYFLGGQMKHVKNGKVVRTSPGSGNGLYTIIPIQGDELSQSKIKWIDTESDSCFWGRWDFFRILMLLVIAGFILKLVIPKWR